MNNIIICFISVTIILFPVGDDNIDENRNMDQSVDYNNNSNYNRDGRLSPREAALCKKCANTEFFLTRIFPYSE